MELDDIKDAPDFSKCLDGVSVKAKIVSVYDGDSIKAIFNFHGNYLKWNCRLDGIDTPEIRTRDLKEKQYGLFVRDELKKLILDKIVTLKCGELDKYGRLLIKIYLDKSDKSVNEWLINKKFAQVYTGGKKNSWDNNSIPNENKPLSPSELLKNYIFFSNDRQQI